MGNLTMTPRSATADTRHGTVHYRTIGAGPPLVLLHATPKSSRSFAKLMPYLAATHRVIAPDTLGFGESAPLPRDVTMTMLAESMADLLIPLEATPAVVFGIHTGNKIGAALTSSFPELVSHFILCGMTHSIILDRETRETAIKTLVGTPFSKTDISQDEKQDREQGAKSVDAIYAANYDFDLTVTLASLDVPTTVLELVTPEEKHLGQHAEAVAAHIPGARARTFKGSDRDALDHRPNELADIILTCASA